MNKRDTFSELLQSMLADTGRLDELEAMLVANSNLPGPRGNIELALAFGDCLETGGIDDGIWRLLLKWIDISPEEAPVGDPREFLPFCAAQGLAACLVNAKKLSEKPQAFANRLTISRVIAA